MQNTIRKLHLNETFLKLEITTKDELIKRLKTETVTLQAQISSLQDKLAGIAEKAATRPTTTNNNIIQQNNQLNNFQPITEEHLRSHADNLTLDHIKKGPSGYAKFASEYPFKDKLICTDYSRRKVKYKNEDGDVVTDPKMATLTKKFFAAIKDRNSALISGYFNEMKEKIWGSPDDNDEMDEKETKRYQAGMEKMNEIIFAVIARDKQVKEIAEGYKSELFYKFIEDVCASCVKK
jgi:hypothetical protein